MRRKISADVDGGLSGVSRCADTGARTPIGVSGIILIKAITFFKLWLVSDDLALRSPCKM